MSVAAIHSPPMESFARYLKRKTFTFVVGTEQERYRVHPAVFEAISLPLHYLMNNGKMEEFFKGEARLEDIDPAIFEQLLGFAYLGICGVADGIDSAATSHTTPTEFDCHMCSGKGTKSYPFCSNECQSQYMTAYANIGQAYDGENLVYCMVFGCSKTFDVQDDRRMVCSIHTKDKYQKKYPKVIILAGPFNSLRYGAAGLSHNALQQHLDKHRNRGCKKFSLLEHAALYVLADRYLVHDLKDICLHKLHRALMSFETKVSSIDEVTALITYIYSNTADGGDILKCSNDALRRLIMMYVHEYTEKLVQYSSFRDMLGAGGAHTVDFIALKHVKGV